MTLRGKEPPSFTELTFCWPCSPHIRAIYFPSENSLEKLIFHLKVVINWRLFLDQDEGMCLLLSGADPCRSCGYHLTLCEFICVFILLIQRPLLPWRPPSSLALPLFLSPLLWGSLSPEERDLVRCIVLLFRAGCFKFSCSLHDA